jgi:hypothetical protein
VETKLVCTIRFTGGSVLNCDAVLGYELDALLGGSAR